MSGHRLKALIKSGLVCFSLFAKILFAQNLLSNGGFENFVTCPTAPSQIELASSWTSSGGTPDFFHRCGNSASIESVVTVPNHYLGTQSPLEGDGYGGLILEFSAANQPREYMTTQLPSPLLEGVCYYVEFYVNLSEAGDRPCDQFGVFVSDEPIALGSDTLIEPQYNYREFIEQEEGWKLISDSFVADGGERYLAIGNFGTCTLPNSSYSIGDLSYYFIDEIKLISLRDSVLDVYLCEPDECFRFGDQRFCETGTYIIPLESSLNSICPRNLQLNIFKEIVLELTQDNCNGLPTNLSASTQIPVPNISYEWSGVDFVGNGTTVTVENAGEYQVVANYGGCIIDSVIDIYENIVAQLIEEIVLYQGESMRLEPVLSFPESAIETASWFPDDQLSCDNCLNPQFSALRNTNLSLLINLANGCIAMANTMIDVTEVNSRVYLPNAFSPGQLDGINDRFMAFTEIGQPAEILRFDIVDRWGTLVFRKKNIPTNDLSAGWDGRFEGKMCASGVYGYYVEIEFPNGQRVDRAGTVNLLR
ncbi:MAG: gliding motility-associated C-terminal domain-containing protein [Bacteroidota bacterium]